MRIKDLELFVVHAKVGKENVISNFEVIIFYNKK